MSKFIVYKNNKIIAHEDSVEDIESTIYRDFNIKKQEAYEVINLETDEVLCIVEMLDRVRLKKTPRKEFKFPDFKKSKQAKQSGNKAFKKPEHKSFDYEKAKAKAEQARKKALEKSRDKPKKSKPKKRRVGKNDVIDDKYSVWLGTQPCVLTGKVGVRGIAAYNIHCHHIYGRRPKNDYLQVPLMGALHTWDNHSYHIMGKHSFLVYWRDEMNMECLQGVEDITEFFNACAINLKKKYDSL